MDKKLASYLGDHCHSEKLAMIAAAVASHPNCAEAKMIKLDDQEHHVWGSIGTKYGERDKIQNAEVLFVRLNDKNCACGVPESHAALFYEHLDLVVFCDESEYDCLYDLKPLCAMKTSAFFQYLDTLPNPFKFADKHQGIRGATLLGLEYLETLKLFQQEPSSTPE